MYLSSMSSPVISRMTGLWAKKAGERTSHESSDGEPVLERQSRLENEGQQRPAPEIQCLLWGYMRVHHADPLALR